MKRTIKKQHLLTYIEENGKRRVCDSLKARERNTHMGNDREKRKISVKRISHKNYLKKIINIQTFIKILPTEDKRTCVREGLQEEN